MDKKHTQAMYLGTPHRVLTVSGVGGVGVSSEAGYCSLLEIGLSVERPSQWDGSPEGPYGAYHQCPCGP